MLLKVLVTDILGRKNPLSHAQQVYLVIQGGGGGGYSALKLCNTITYHIDEDGSNLANL